MDKVLLNDLRVVKKAKDTRDQAIRSNWKSDVESFMDKGLMAKREELSHLEKPQEPQKPEKPREPSKPEEPTPKKCNATMQIDAVPPKGGIVGGAIVAGISIVPLLTSLFTYSNVIRLNEEGNQYDWNMMTVDEYEHNSLVALIVGLSILGVGILIFLIPYIIHLSGEVKSGKEYVKREREKVSGRTHESGKAAAP